MKALLFGFALLVLALDAHAGKYPRETVVKLEQPGPMGGSGSAVVLQPGLLLTARHVADNEGLMLGSAATRIVGGPKDESMDVVVLKTTVRCPCAELADSDARQDEMVTIIGWPLGVANTVVHGEAQGVQDVPYRGTMRALIVAAQTEGGFSGGGAFVKRNGRWQLVGILVAGSQTQSLIVPVSDIRKWLEGRE